MIPYGDIHPTHTTILCVLMTIILQEVQKEINKMIEEAATSESDDLSNDTVKGRRILTVT